MSSLSIPSKCKYIYIQTHSKRLVVEPGIRELEVLFAVHEPEPCLLARFAVHITLDMQLASETCENTCVSNYK